MLRYRWLFVVGVTVASIVASVPPREKVRLGLDLRGGIHLVLGVQTDDAVRAALDEAVQRLQGELTGKSIPFQELEPKLDRQAGLYQVVLGGVKPEDEEKARRAAESALAEFRREPVAGGLVASLPALRVDELRNQAVDQALNTIRERVDATGVVEPRIQREGLRGERILIQLPGIRNPEQVKRLIGKVALLELKLVDHKGGPHRSREQALAQYGGKIPATLELLEGRNPDPEGGADLFYVVERVPMVTGRDLARAQMARDEYQQPAVAFTMNALGATKFGEATGKNKGRYLAIVLDGRVYSAPVIQSRISDRGQISGAFTQQEARDLALVLRAGALPAKVSYLEERTVEPYLGEVSIRQGVFTGTVGLLLITILMVVYYRRSGINAIVALVLNGVLLLGALAVLRATLTLPGIAGFILTLGMAVDANILIFEAIREYLRQGMSVKAAVQEGFDRAFSTILDSNLTTLLAAGALWMLGSGPIRGFGVTLFIGLVINMFTAYYVSKLIFETFSLRRDWKPGETLSI